MKKQLVVILIFLLGVLSCNVYKKVPATMSGFENGKGSIKGPILESEIVNSKIVLNSDDSYDEFYITPLENETKTSFQKDGGIIRVPNKKVKNIFTFETPVIFKVLNTTFYQGENFPDKINVFYIQEGVRVELPMVLNVDAGIYYLKVEKKEKEKIFIYEDRFGKRTKRTEKIVFYEKGPYGYIFISPMDNKKYQINNKNIFLENIFVKNQKQKINKIKLKGYKKPK